MIKKTKGPNTKLINDSLDTKQHFKLYKAGRKWVVAGITTLSFVGGLGIATQTADAATTTTTDAAKISATADSTTNDSKTVTLTSSSQGDQTSQATQADQATQSNQAEKSTATAPTTADDQEEEPTVKTSLSTDSADNSKLTAEQTQAEGVQSETQTSAETVKSSASVAPADQNETAKNTVTVTKDNFEDYFKVNGSAAYDASTGIIKLTTDAKNQSGNVTLKNKISASQSFTLTGQLYLGTQSQSNGGADGVSFGFHSGKVNEVGMDGGSLSFAGLPNAFGWKADTYWDGDGRLQDTGYFDADPSQFRSSREAFGAFVYTKDVADKYKALTVDDDQTPAQAITQPNGTWQDFSISYDASNTSMTVNYDGKTWTEDVSSYLPFDNSNALAFFIAAATGGSTNLQQFKIDEFTYVAYGTGHVHYVDDTTGQELTDYETELDGTIGDTVNLTDQIAQTTTTIEGLGKGYSMTDITVLDGTTFDPTTKVFTYTTFPGDVTVHFTRQSAQATIHYVDDTTGQEFTDYTSNLDGKVGDTVDLKSEIDETTKTIENLGKGYTLTDITAGKGTTFDMGNDVLTYTTTPGDVIVHFTRQSIEIAVAYVDEGGQTIATGTVLYPDKTQYVGDPYETTKLSIPGYTFKEMKDGSLPASGTLVTNGTVTYVYTKNATTTSNTPEPPSTTPTTPTTPTPHETTPEPPATTPITPATTPKKTPEQPTTPPTTPEKKTTPTAPHRIPQNGENGQSGPRLETTKLTNKTAPNQVQVSEQTSPNSEKNRLPQTGEETTPKATILVGLGLLMAELLVALGFRKNRREQ